MWDQSRWVTDGLNSGELQVESIQVSYRGDQSRWVTGEINPGSRWVTDGINRGELQVGLIQVSSRWDQSRWVTGGINPGESGEMRLKIQVSLMRCCSIYVSYILIRWVTKRRMGHKWTQSRSVIWDWERSQWVIWVTDWLIPTRSRQVSHGWAKSR